MKLVIGRDLLSDSSDFLVSNRFALVNCVVANVKYEIAILVDLKFFGSVEAKSYLFRVNSGCNHEIIFELALITVINEIDSLINTRISDGAIICNVGPPFFGVIAEVRLLWCQFGAEGEVVAEEEGARSPNADLPLRPERNLAEGVAAVVEVRAEEWWTVLRS